MARAPNCSWGGPYVICSQLSPVVYRVRRMNETREISVHLAYLKPYHPRETPPAPEFDKLAELSWENKFPYPRWTILVKLNQQLSHTSLTEWSVTSLDRAGKVCTILNTAWHMRLRGYGPESDLEYRADEVPRCHALIAAYRTKNGLHIAPPENTTYVRTYLPRSQNAETRKWWGMNIPTTYTSAPSQNSK